MELRTERIERFQFDVPLAVERLATWALLAIPRWMIVCAPSRGRAPTPLYPTRRPNGNLMRAIIGPRLSYTHSQTDAAEAMRIWQLVALSVCPSAERNVTK